MWSELLRNAVGSSGGVCSLTWKKSWMMLWCSTIFWAYGWHQSSTQFCPSNCYHMWPLHIEGVVKTLAGALNRSESDSPVRLTTAWSTVQLGRASDFYHVWRAVLPVWHQAVHMKTRCATPQLLASQAVCDSQGELVFPRFPCFLCILLLSCCSICTLDRPKVELISWSLS